jgi:hypothetical protein
LVADLIALRHQGRKLGRLPKLPHGSQADRLLAIIEDDRETPDSISPNILLRFAFVEGELRAASKRQLLHRYGRVALHQSDTPSRECAVQISRLMGEYA